MSSLMKLTYPATFLAILIFSMGCTTLQTTGKVIVTPLTVVRDTVDAPLVSTTNVFEYFAQQSKLAKAPHAGVGWSVKGGFNFGIGYDISYLLFKGLSGIFGVVDYIPCRSVWPNFAKGISPWKQKEENWGSLYFPNTRALWSHQSSN